MKTQQQSDRKREINGNVLQSISEFICEQNDVDHIKLIGNGIYKFIDSNKVCGWATMAAIRNLSTSSIHIECIWLKVMIINTYLWAVYGGYRRVICMSLKFVIFFCCFVAAPQKALEFMRFEISGIVIFSFYSTPFCQLVMSCKRENSLFCVCCCCRLCLVLYLVGSPSAIIDMLHMSRFYYKFSFGQNIWYTIHSSNLSGKYLNRASRYSIRYSIIDASTHLISFKTP